MARSWQPSFTHADRERWICVYPAYINSKKTREEGRKVPKDRAVENPLCAEIKDVLTSVGLPIGLENKVYPRERDCFDPKSRGRIRVQIKNADGTLVLEKFPDRHSVFLYLGDTIPKLKARQGHQGAAGAGGSAAASGGAESAASGPSRKQGRNRKK